MKEINLCKPSMLSKVLPVPIAHANPASFIAYGQGGQNHIRPEETSPTLSMTSPILAGLSVTMTPAFSRAATLSFAAPDRDDQYPVRKGGQ